MKRDGDPTPLSELLPDVLEHLSDWHTGAENGSGEGDELSEIEDYALEQANQDVSSLVRRRPKPGYMPHERYTLRHAYVPTADERPLSKDGDYFSEKDAEQLPLITYEYPNLSVMSRLGELIPRDMCVMSAITNAFLEAGCPSNDRITGDEATLNRIARQLGLSDRGATSLVRASLERLTTAKVKHKRRIQIHTRDGVETTEKQEIVFGFIQGFGSRERSRAGKTTSRSNYIQLDPVMAEFIRRGEFVMLNTGVLRSLKGFGLALRLYGWLSTHAPGPPIHYGLDKLAEHIGYKDKNAYRRRKRLLEAADAVLKAEPQEFSRMWTEKGVRGQTVLFVEKVRPLRMPQHQRHEVPASTVQLPGERPSLVADLDAISQRRRVAGA